MIFLGFFILFSNRFRVIFCSGIAFLTAFDCLFLFCLFLIVVLLGLFYNFQAEGSEFVDVRGLLICEGVVPDANGKFAGVRVCE